ncbi:MAG: Ig-like domain-containing protein [Bacteroidales bacterium]|jgi:hypothetical protein|nr:Ig-like domain-containing protein [Bacteroidales bacterium]
MKRKHLSIVLASLLALVAGLSSCTKEIPVTGITIEQENLTLQVGSSAQLTISISPLDATHKEATYSSRNESIATVTENGTVTGIAVGETWVLASTIEGGFRDSCAILVEPASGSTVVLSGNLTDDITLKSDIRYLLDGWVYVKDGATMTIEPGTVIQGKTGSKASLVIERGGKIMADGTQGSPIIFTSDKPAGERQAGDWGGIIICGKAPINPTGGEAEIEGGVGSKFGGIDPDDNSGVLRYVRIEYAGYAFAPDKEINGLTFGGVGRGTTVEYIQVSYCNDDSYEWFGGTVNCRYLVALGGLDDEFDTDYGFNGFVQYVVGLRDPNVADISKSNGFESDNDATGSTNAPITNPKFANVSLFGPKPTVDSPANSLYQNAMHLRRRTALEVYNSVFAGWPRGLLMADSKGAAGNVELKGIVMAGMNDNFSGNTAGEETFYLDPTRANRLFTSTAELQVNNPFQLTAPNFLPKAGSPLLTGAVEVPEGLEATTFIGAFGGTDWTLQWTNWNPQITNY